MHSLAGKEYFLDPEKTHIGHYKVKISSNFVFTDVPLHWMHWSDFFNKHVQVPKVVLLIFGNHNLLGSRAPVASPLFCSSEARDGTCRAIVSCSNTSR